MNAAWNTTIWITIFLSGVVVSDPRPLSEVGPFSIVECSAALTGPLVVLGLDSSEIVPAAGSARARMCIAHILGRHAVPKYVVLL